jgi:hypothetical protein
MGGFGEGNPPPPAPDYPPENAFDINSFVSGVIKAAQDSGAVIKGGGIVVEGTPGWLLKEILAGIGVTGDALGALLAVVAVIAEPLLKALLKAALVVLEPAVEVGGDLAGAFVQVLVQGLVGAPHGGRSIPVNPGTGAAAQMFDSIMAPLMGLTAAENPATVGSGQLNAQFTLGGITAIHLHTWIINIIANVTGLGVLKFINSFDEAVTGSLNARALGRGAMKPYLDKFIATPLTRDLNVAMPLAIGAASQLVKRYIRGDIDNTTLKAQLRGLGYDDNVAADMLLDAAKLLDVSAVVYLAKLGTWTDGQAIQALQQAGYPDTLARAAFQKEYNSKVDSQTDSLADDLLTLAKDHRLEIAALVTALQKAGFTDEEVTAYQTRAAYAQEISKRISYTQVKSLFAESLVNMDYVLSFLMDEGYSTTDADLLVLLEFTKKEERDQTRLLLANIRRAQLEQGLKNQAAADAARKAALALLPT